MRIYTNKQIKRRNEMARRRYAKDPAKGRAVVHAQYVKHRSIILEHQQARYRLNRKKYVAAAKAYRKRYPARILKALQKYRKANVEKLKARRNAWRLANLEKAKAANMRWRKANPEKVRAQLRKYHHAHRGDPKFILNHHVRTVMSHVLNRTLEKKNRRSWQALVGYTVGDLKKHIELNFSEGMTWGNKKLWHIDHIIPLVEWHFDGPAHPEFKAAWSLRNLRPVWAKVNLIKNRRLPTLKEFFTLRLRGEKP